VKLPDVDSDFGNPRDRGGVWRVPLIATTWALAGGACTAAAWAIGFRLTSALIDPPLSHVDEADLPAMMQLFGTLGAIVGVLVGLLVGLISGSQDRAATVVSLAVGGVFAGALGGGLSPLAVFAGERVISPLISSTISWATAGSLAGVVAYVVFRWMSESPEPEVEEDATQPRQQATTWQPLERGRRLQLGPILRFFPILGASGFALVGSAITSSRPLALTLLAMGLLGLSTAYTMFQHDRRLTRLEEKFRGSK
jgi:hypothetical protein